MRWKAKIENKPGQEAQTIEFAFFPTRINDHWVWLEKYIQKYKYLCINDQYDGCKCKWYEVNRELID